MKFRGIKCFLVALGLFVVGCGKPSTEEGSSLHSSISIAMPDRSLIRNGPVERLTGYQLAIISTIGSCHGFKNIQEVKGWNEKTLNYTLPSGCGYQITMDVGFLQTAGSSLSEIYYSNSNNPYNLTMEQIAKNPKVVVDLKLKATSLGVQVGFGSQLVNGNQNNNINNINNNILPPNNQGNINQNNNNNIPLTVSSREVEPDVDWHSIFDGVSWRIADGFIETNDGDRPIGSLSLVSSCLETFGSSFQNWSDQMEVKVAQLYATAITESGCRNLDGSGDGLSSGIMQVTGSTCNSLLQKIGRPFDSSEGCKSAMSSDPELSIELAARYISDPGQTSNTAYDGISRSEKGLALDPPKVAAGYNAGSLRESSSNKWHMVSTGDHIDRYISAYNAFVSWTKQNSGNSISLTSASIKSYTLRVNTKFPVSVTDKTELELYSGRANEGDAIFVGDFKAKNGDFYYFIDGKWRASTDSW